MSGRNRWLDSGLEALADEGPGGLKIDRLVRRVGLTKGSFFHHFPGAAAYKTALLERLEADATAALDEASARPAGHRTAAGARGADRQDRPVRDPGCGGRSWRSRYGPGRSPTTEVRQTQARIDRQRLAGLEAIWQRLEPDRQQARIKALLPYLMAVGASMSSVVVDSEELQQIYRAAPATRPLLSLH